MRHLLNGVEGGKLGLYRGADAVLLSFLTADDGSEIDLTGGAVNLVLYDTIDRRNAAILSLSGTLTTASGGYVTNTLTAAGMANIVQGTYYMFAVYVDSGGLTTVSKNYTTVTIK